MLQTVLLALLGSGSVVTVSGGTHNPLAPSFDHFSRVFLPLLSQHGPKLSAALVRHGLYPVGGGEVQVRIQGGFERPFDLGRLRGDESLSAWTLSQGILAHVESRELKIVASELSIPFERCERRTANSPGSGNVLEIQVGEHELVTSHGARGKSAEQVAAEALTAVRAYLSSGVSVGEYLADQLMLPLALAGGRFLTGPLSLHATTNLRIIQRFLGDQSITTRVIGELVEVNAPGTPLGSVNQGS